MPTEKALLQFAPKERAPEPAELDRTAGVITIVGCCATLLAPVLPIVEKALLSVTFPGVGIQGPAVLLILLAGVSAGLAGTVLLRRPATSTVALVLVVLAVAQVGLAIWDSATTLRAISQENSHQVLIRAIGSGAYLGVLGAAITLAGGILASVTLRRE